MLSGGYNNIETSNIETSNCFIYIHLIECFLSGPVFCHLAQQQTVSTCITGARSPNMVNDTISLPWEDLDPYAFPLVAILGKWWRSYRTTHAGESLWLLLLAQHAWFWDLLIMSSQIPWYLSNLLSQPFNQTPHRNLSNLDLYAWLLEPPQSRSRASLRQWQ